MPLPPLYEDGSNTLREPDLPLLAIKPATYALDGVPNAAYLLYSLYTCMLRIGNIKVEILIHQKTDTFISLRARFHKYMCISQTDK